MAWHWPKSPQSLLYGWHAQTEVRVKSVSQLLSLQVYLRMTCRVFFLWSHDQVFAAYRCQAWSLYSAKPQLGQEERLRERRNCRDSRVSRGQQRIHSTTDRVWEHDPGASHSREGINVPALCLWVCYHNQESSRRWFVSRLRLHGPADACSLQRLCVCRLLSFQESIGVSPLW